MRNTWSCVVFSLAARLVSASVIISAELNVPNATVTMAAPALTTFITATTAALNTTQLLNHTEIIPTLVTEILTATDTATAVVITTATDEAVAESSSNVESIFNPSPAIPPFLTIISNYQAPTPVPGSIAIINGIPTRVLDNTIQQNTTFLADAAELDSRAEPKPGGSPSLPPSGVPYQPWDTNYEGPIHDDDWKKYLQIWDQVWWAQNLDSMRHTACMCSDDDFLTNKDARLASWMDFEFHSHQTGALYAIHMTCGPAKSSMSLLHRVTSAKGEAEICWQAAGGEYAGDHPLQDLKGYYCDANKELCVEAWRAGQRSLKFHGHKRNYDRDGVHMSSEIQPVVREICEPICRDRFKMQYNDFGMHNPNFRTTFYPPKPIHF